MHNATENINPLIFAADYSEYPIASQAEDARRLTQAWDQVQKKLNSPELCIYQQYSSALYCACQLAVAQRAYINISYLPFLNQLMIGLSSPIFLFEHTQQLSTLTAASSEVYARCDRQSKSLILTFICEA